MAELFLMAVIVWACMGLGRAFLSLTRSLDDVLSDRVVLSLAIGIGMLAMLVLGFGLLGFLYKEFFVGLIIVLVVSTFRWTFPDAKLLFNRSVEFFKQLDWWDKTLVLLCAVTALLVMTGALAPAIGQDELCYHLQQPKNYVKYHKVYDVPFCTNGLWAYLMEMLFTLGLLLKNTELAKLFHWVMYLLAGGMVFCVSKRFFEKKTALYAAAAFMLTPMMYLQASFAYLENALALYFLGAFYGAYLFLETGKKRYAFISGCMAGFCLSTKLIGLFCVPAILVIIIIHAVYGKRRWISNAGWGSLLFISALLLFGSAFYVRSYILRGNPVFPFYPQFFNGNGWTDPTYTDSHGRGQSIFDYLLILWDTAMHPDWFGGENIGFLYLALAPLVFLWQNSLILTCLLVFSAVVAAQWFIVDPNIRFFSGAMPIFSILSGVAITVLVSLRSGSKLFKALIWLIFIVQASFAIHHFDETTVILFNGNKEAYLRKHERTYSVAKAINAMLAADDKILAVEEIRGYYFNNDFTLEGDMESFTHYARGIKSEDELRRYLKGLGFTHVLVYLPDTPLVHVFPKDESLYRVGNFLTNNKEKVFFKTEAVIRSNDVRYALYRIL